MFVRFTSEGRVSIQMKWTKFKVIEGRNKQVLVSFKKIKGLHCLFNSFMGQANHGKHPESYACPCTVSKCLFSLINGDPFVYQIKYSLTSRLKAKKDFTASGLIEVIAEFLGKCRDQTVHNRCSVFSVCALWFYLQ